MNSTQSFNYFELIKSRFNPFAEEVWVLALNSQLKVLNYDLIFKGTADCCLVHPRDILRFVILENASFFILAHNHPSLSITPSDEDLKFTKRIYRLSQLVEIPLVDHIIFSHLNYFSFADSRVIIGQNPRQPQKYQCFL